MKVVLHSISAGPEGCTDAGQPIEMSAKEAKRLIKEGTAREFTDTLAKAGQSVSAVAAAVAKVTEDHAAEVEAARKSRLAVLGALMSLDHGSDHDWDADGKPNLDRLQELLGSTSLSRADVDAIAPTALRKTFNGIGDHAEGSGAPAAEAAETVGAAATSGPRSNKP